MVLVVTAADTLTFMGKYELVYGASLYLVAFSSSFTFIAAGRWASVIINVKKEVDAESGIADVRRSTGGKFVTL